MKYNNLAPSQNVSDRRQNYNPVYGRAQARAHNVSDAEYEALVKELVYSQEKEYERRFPRQSVHPGTEDKVMDVEKYQLNPDAYFNVGNKIAYNTLSKLVTDWSFSDYARNIDQKANDIATSVISGRSLLPSYTDQNPEKTYPGDLVEGAGGKFLLDPLVAVKRMLRDNKLLQYKNAKNPLSMEQRNEIRNLLLNKQIISKGVK